MLIDRWLCMFLATVALMVSCEAMAMDGAQTSLIHALASKGYVMNEAATEIRYKVPVLGGQPLLGKIFLVQPVGGQEVLGNTGTFIGDFDSNVLSCHLKNILCEKGVFQKKINKLKARVLGLQRQIFCLNARNAIVLVSCALLVAGLADHVWGKQLVARCYGKVRGWFISEKEKADPKKM